MCKLMLWQYSLDDPIGELHRVQLDKNDIQLDEMTRQLPSGVYTTFRTYHKYHVLFFQDHIERLEHSAAGKNIEARINPQILRKNIRSVLQQHPAEENRIRITLTPLKSSPPQIYLAVEDLVVPARELYQSGVKVLTTSLQRLKPDVKDTEFIRRTQFMRSTLTNGLNEVLMISSDRQILEGLSSNFFAVSEGILFTQGEGVLPGITRKLVLEVAARKKISVNFKGISIDELDSITEVFITSASRGVLPVVKIDQVVIGNGKPGRITTKITAKFNEMVESLVEPF